MQCYKGTLRRLYCSVIWGTGRLSIGSISRGEGDANICSVKMNEGGLSIGIVTRGREASLYALIKWDRSASL